MADTTNYTFRIDNKIKSQSEAIFDELGMNLTTAINVFLRESIRVGGFPFDVRLHRPNRETLEAMAEAKQIIGNGSARKYDDIEEALAELKR